QRDRWDAARRADLVPLRREADRHGNAVEGAEAEGAREERPCCAHDRQQRVPTQGTLIRGAASVTMMDGIVPEYAAAAERYFGAEQGKAWCDNLANLGVTRMGRIAVTPDWVGVLDFQTRFPSAVSP